MRLFDDGQKMTGTMKVGVKRIIIDPRSRINYASYYIKGFATVYGWGKIVFDLVTVPEIGDQQDYYRGCTVLIEGSEGEIYRVFIDSHDSNTVHERFYEWADVYAKINVRPDDVGREKLLVIGPGFGIRLWNPVKTMLIGVRNLLKCKFSAHFPFSAKTYLLDYAYTFVRRNDISVYATTEMEESKDYVFALSTLWYDAQTYSTTNRYRGTFAKVCKKLYPVFEGGFFYIPSADVARQFPQYREYLEEYKDMLITRRIGMKEYLKKTKLSSIVFNTPSVLGCHGWKLGEFLAMGKAIISTPLNNMMPGEFAAGKHYIEVNSVEDIASAVSLLKNNEALRQDLKKNAREYYAQYVDPKAAVYRIIERLKGL